MPPDNPANKLPEFGDPVGDGLGVPFGDPVGEGLGVPLGEPVGPGLGVPFGEPVGDGEAPGEPEGDGVGVTEPKVPARMTSLPTDTCIGVPTEITGTVCPLLVSTWK